ncbi:PadR family transcriptional regulator [Herbiconiux moechotypicola]|uniref:Transcription regulator PadR N-terminal domain-containing protein n=1 Tax=Herbiconiux moechotypicola TaxID=637393 RepID=A0ABN3DZK4_9MICO|nr:PadR family transcriptional regulator [Herbiconiux moechotypicola]MCS5730881.1 PadR family transcriptional regulator [Herbiconiux moechotypicola]
MSPVFGHGHLRLYLLSLLDESPKHGYELIQSLSDRFGGTYSPSAGTIYPRLAKLEEEGLVTKTADGRKTVYAITDAGRAELEARRGELDDIEEELSDSVRRLADEVRSGVNQAMRSLKADLASAARDARSAAKASGASTRASATWEPAPSADGEGFPTRAESAAALRDADIALTEFRQALRGELRKASARALDPALVARLRARLGEVQAEFREQLRTGGR